jgi:hypothetical protein
MLIGHEYPLKRRQPRDIRTSTVGQVLGGDQSGPISGMPVRAAQYVRMSTEHQKYSTENQSEAIQNYAARRGIEIVRTYADEGKSGLSLGGRDALKRLIDDVQAKRTDFATILVYDVSRWGRFQDADESAYYEYICKRSGISVQYCAEQFIGYTPERDYRYIEINRALRRMHPNIVADVIAGIEQAGGIVEQDPATELLNVNGEFTASIVVVRCRTTTAGSLRWKIRFDVGLWPDITVAVRMDGLNQNHLDYYLLPRIDMTAARLQLAEDNGISLDAYRFPTLEVFFVLAARVSLREVA